MLVCEGKVIHESSYCYKMTAWLFLQSIISFILMMTPANKDFVVCSVKFGYQFLHQNLGCGADCFCCYRLDFFLTFSSKLIRAIIRYRILHGFDLYIFDCS